MYELLHVPTGTTLAKFKHLVELWDWLEENPGFTRSDLVVNKYQLIETKSLDIDDV